MKTGSVFPCLDEEQYLLADFQFGGTREAPKGILADSAAVTHAAI